MLEILNSLTKQGFTIKWANFETGEIHLMANPPKDIETSTTSRIKLSDYELSLISEAYNQSFCLNDAVRACEQFMDVSIARDFAINYLTKSGLAVLRNGYVVPTK